MTIPTLPAEILIHIAQFLPPECLVHLYGVSKAFMDLAFDAKYGTLNIDSTFWCPVKGREYVRHLKHLSKPHVARHISTIKICANFSFDQLRDNLFTRCWSYFVHVQLPSIFGPFSPSVRNILGSGLWRYERFVRSMTKLTMVMPAYSNIKSLSLTFPPQHTRSGFRIGQLLHALIPTVAHGIEELRLEGIAETILNAIPAKPTFDSLRILDIVVKDDDMAEHSFRSNIGGKETSLRVAQLVNCYADTLVKLSITLPAWSEFDAEAMFACFSEFSSLSSLRVMVSRWPQPCPLSLFNFIALHAWQIQHLTIPPPVGMATLETTWFPSNLCSLEIFTPAEIVEIDVDTGVIGELIHHAARTLQNLVMNCHAPAYIHTIGDTLSTHNYPRLRRLCIRVRILSPYDLQTILSKFPWIMRLEILANKILATMNTWESHDSTAQWHMEVEEFIKISRNVKFGKCFTRTIIIWVDGLRRDVDGYEMRYAIPSLECMWFKAGKPIV